MQIDLAGAVGGVATAISVLDEYFRELHRIERIPRSISLGQSSPQYELTLHLDEPRFDMAKPQGQDPYTRLVLTGKVDRRDTLNPISTTDVFPVDVTVKLSLVKLPANVVGLQFEGVDGVPSTPLTNGDISSLFLGPVLFPLIDGFRLPTAQRVIDGLQDGTQSLNPTAFEVTLMPAGSDTVDSFVATFGFANVIPAIRESFLPNGQEFAIAFSQWFMDQILSTGANAQVGKSVEGAKIGDPLEIYMNQTSMQVSGSAKREVWSVFPDVTVTFVGPMHPYLVRGTTIMGFNMDDIDIDVGTFAEAFYFILKWFLILFAGAALLSGWGWLTLAGLAAWGFGEVAWSYSVDLENAPNYVREGLATSLGGALAVLSESLSDDTPVGQLTVDATPDSLQVVNAHLIFVAQVLVVRRTMQLVSAEYSKKLRRFVIFELSDGRRFRAQELARLMALGKLTIPGFHQVAGNYIRANPDNVAANNLLKSFKANLASEAVFRNV